LSAQAFADLAPVTWRCAWRFCPKNRLICDGSRTLGFASRGGPRWHHGDGPCLAALISLLCNHPVNPENPGKMLVIRRRRSCAACRQGSHAHRRQCRQN
jgi:hypothetical protein